jgi:hypothetical protein
VDVSRGQLTVNPQSAKPASVTLGQLEADQAPSPKDDDKQDKSPGSAEVAQSNADRTTDQARQLIRGEGEPVEVAGTDRSCIGHLAAAENTLKAIANDNAGADVVTEAPVKVSAPSCARQIASRPSAEADPTAPSPLLIAVWTATFCFFTEAALMAAALADNSAPSPRDQAGRNQAGRRCRRGHSR